MSKRGDILFTDENFLYFKENQTELFEKYPNKCLVIKNKEVIHTEDSIPECVRYAIDNNLIGRCYIQLCGEDEKCYYKFYS